MADCYYCLCRKECRNLAKTPMKYTIGSYGEGHCVRYREATKPQQQYYGKLEEQKRQSYYSKFGFDAKTEDSYLKNEIERRKQQNLSYGEYITRNNKKIAEIDQCLEEFERDHVAELVAAEI
jgi:hypothetical protein